MASNDERIEWAVHWLEDHFTENPELVDLAVPAVSVFHTQPLFKQWAGIRAKQFTPYLSVACAMQLLAPPPSILNVTYALGLSAPGRLHNPMVHIEAVSPGECNGGR